MNLSQIIQARAVLAAGAALLMGMAGLAARPAAAQTVGTVFSLPTSLQGAQAGVIDGEDGFLYGTAYATGTVYKVRPDGTGFAILHSFSAGPDNRYPDGQYPRRELVLGGDGALYGTASGGGAGGSGTIYRVSRDGAAFAVLYSFSAEDGSFHNPDGASPFGGLAVGGDGALYGTAEYGGVSGRGTAFRIALDGSGFQVLHQFSAAGSADIATNGSLPVAGLTGGGDGSFYGTTAFGGANGYGTVYRLTADGSRFMLLHSFTAAEGSSQTALVRANDGRFYGTCFQGGANLQGLLFGLAVDGTGFQTLHTFTAYDGQGHNVDGAAPVGAPAQGPDGALYGATQSGGAYSHGGVYRVTPDGTFQPLASFGASSADPSGPTGTLARVGNTLYGTSPYGGANGFGAIFAVSGVPAPPAAPSGLTATASGHTVSLAWSLADGTDASVLLERQSAGGAWAQTASLPAGSTLYQDTGLALGATYGYRVRAANVSGPSPYSNTASVTLAAPPPAAPTHILWDNTDGTASLWNYSTTDGTFTFNNYGPFVGWTAKAIADGAADGRMRVLWTNSSGQMSLWSLDNSAGLYANREFGPYAGWAAQAVSAGADNATHVLWTNADGTASVWNYRTADGSFTQHAYGPYPGWTARAIADGGADGKTRVLWANADGRMSLWSLDSAGGGFTQHTFGPYAGWSARSVSAAQNNTTHVLWTNSNGMASLWNYDTAGGGFTQNAFGPYSGWAASGVADGPDGRVRVLWDNTNGQMSLWSLDNTVAGGSFTQSGFGPFGGWTAVAVSAAP